MQSVVLSLFYDALRHSTVPLPIPCPDCVCDTVCSCEPLVEGFSGSTVALGFLLGLLFGLWRRSKLEAVQEASEGEVSEEELLAEAGPSLEEHARAQVAALRRRDGLRRRWPLNLQLGADNARGVPPGVISV